MIKLAIAPIGWTNDDLPELGGDIPFEQCISEMALAGFKGCEVGNKYPKDDLEILKKHLEIRGLSICNQWFSYEFTIKALDQVKKKFIEHLNFLKFFGAEIVGGAECGNTIHGEYNKSILDRRPASKDHWKKLTMGLNELGKLAFETYGIQLAYHHHMGTMVETIEETDRLLNETDERYVKLNYDCGHFEFAGNDPKEALSWKPFYSRMNNIVIPNTAYMIKWARENKMEVIFARIACLKKDGKDRSLSQKKPGFNYLLMPKDSEESQIVEELSPQGDEISIIKTTDSA